MHTVYRVSTNNLIGKTQHVKQTWNKRTEQGEGALCRESCFT